MQANDWKMWFISPYYALLYNEKYKAAADAVAGKLVHSLPPQNERFALDVGCGSGHLSVALANKGLNVTGIDTCAPRITEALQHEDENLHFYQHDVRLPFYINYFNYAFNCFTRFGYYRTMREHNDALRTIAQSLKTNGMLVIDYLNVCFEESSLQARETVSINDVVYEIERWQDEARFYQLIQVNDTGNNLKESYSVHVEKFSLGDFTDMLSYQGLQVNGVFGNYDLDSYDRKHSPRMIITATKITT